jgi:hypothetical protein
MNEDIPQFRSYQEEVLARWTNKPIIIASQSELKKQQLSDFGFEDIATSIAIPESVEQNLAHELNEIGGIKSYLAEQGEDIARHIAGAKVRYVIEHSPVPEDATVLGFDTAPVLWSRTDEFGDDTPEHLEKPLTVEAGRKMIHDIINKTAQGCIIRRKRIASYSTQYLSPEDAQMVITNFSAVLRPGTISIISAVAGSFPHNRQQIIGVANEASLYSTAIDEVCDDPYGIEVLADKVADLMGERIVKISGAIDYSDNYIADLLKLKELKIEIMEDTVVGLNHYQGFSQQSLVLLLAHAEASEQTQKTSANS